MESHQRVASGGSADLLNTSGDLLERLQAAFSHAGRNPLGSALARLELLESILPGEANLRALRGSLERLLGILARIEAALRPPPPARRQEMDLGALLGVLAETSAGGEISLQLPPAPVRARSDPKLLAELLGELIANIADLRVAGRLVLEPKPVSIRVEDSGPGVRTELLALLGEAFVTTKVDRLGLGLYRVRRLAERLGITLVWSNRPGGGFSVTLGLEAGGTL